MRCPRCQHENPQGATFCNECGVPLKASTPTGRSAPSYAAVTTALSEALEQQTATSEVLKVISRSTFDLQPVLDILIENATKLCDAPMGGIFRSDGEVLRLGAFYGASRELRKLVQQTQFRPGRESVLGRVALEHRMVHVLDVLADPEYQMVEHQRIGGFRTSLGIPMLREGVLIGAFFLWRTDVRAFTHKQIELLQTFADQAVIAIENVRLFNELQEKNQALTEAHAQVTEALEQQTATAEVLKVISRSAFDLQPVFDTMAENAVRLCEAERAFIFRFDGELLRAAASYNVGPEVREFVYRNPVAPGRHSISARAALERRTVHIPDIQADPDYAYAPRDVDLIRTMLAVPMLKGDELVGTITIYRLEVKPFTDKQVALVETFADQAVIAIENVRLFTELKASNRDLTEALEQQTATGEILRVISGSPTDLGPVLDAVVESAARFCGADDSSIFRVDGDSLRADAHHGPVPQPIGIRYPVVRGTAVGRTVLEGRAIHVADLQAETEDFPEGSATARQLGHRTILSVPLLREGTAIGVIMLRRAEVNPFTDKQIELLQTFADQAVIAIENVRLFTELQASNRELTTALDQQTATSEILRVISRSQTDVQPVFDAIVSSAVRLLQGYSGGLTRIVGDQRVLAAFTSRDPAAASVMRATYPRPADGRARPGHS